MGDAGLVMVMGGFVGPLKNDQDPFPMAGVFPPRVTVEAQIVWSGPAFAGDGLSLIVICTSSMDGAQLLNEIVHLKL